MAGRATLPPSSDMLVAAGAAVDLGDRQRTPPRPRPGARVRGDDRDPGERALDAEQRAPWRGPPRGARPWPSFTFEMNPLTVGTEDVAAVDALLIIDCHNSSSRDWSTFARPRGMRGETTRPGPRRGSWARRARRRAVRFLERRGYVVLARNLRSRLGEVDLLVRDGSTLVSVEAKAWRGVAGDPPEAW